MDLYAFHEVIDKDDGFITHKMSVRDPYKDFYDFPHHDETWHDFKAVFNTILFEWVVWVDGEHVDTMSQVGTYKNQAKEFSPDYLMNLLFC